MMGKKNGLDKVAYILLGLPVLVAAICAVGTVQATIWCIITALGDSEGGGWLLFIMFLLGIVVVPCFVCWIMQCVTYVSGLRRYMEGNIAVARTKGLKCCVVSLIGNIIVFVLGLKILEPEDLSSLDEMLVVIPPVAIICLCMAMIMIRRNIYKENIEETNN